MRNGLRLLTFLVSVGVVLLMASQAQAIFLFYMRKDLDYLLRKKPKKVMGKDVVVTDELTVIWPQSIKDLEAHEGDERIKTPIEDPKSGEEKEWVLFTTTYFKCAVPSEKVGKFFKSIQDDALKGYGELAKQLADINKRAALDHRESEHLSLVQAEKERTKLYWQLYRVWKNKPIVTIYARVMRADFWGKVNDDARGEGVATETITLVVEKIEKPRKRWYRNLDD